MHCTKNICSSYFEGTNHAAIPSCWATFNAKKIFASNESYQKWLNNFIKTNPGIENSIPTKFRQNLEEEAFTEQLFDLSNSLSELKLDEHEWKI